MGPEEVILAAGSPNEEQLDKHFGGIESASACRTSALQNLDSMSLARSSKQ
jgi:hypothetical protein